LPKSAAGYAAHNLVHNLESRSITIGFSYLSQEAGFDISEELLEYDPTHSYGRAFVVGLAAERVGLHVAGEARLAGLDQAVLVWENQTLSQGDIASQVGSLINSTKQEYKVNEDSEALQLCKLVEDS
jgi:hypothetical protein